MGEVDRREEAAWVRLAGGGGEEAAWARELVEEEAASTGRGGDVSEGGVPDIFLFHRAPVNKDFQTYMLVT